MILCRHVVMFLNSTVIHATPSRAAPKPAPCGRQPANVGHAVGTSCQRPQDPTPGAARISSTREPNCGLTPAGAGPSKTQNAHIRDLCGDSVGTRAYGLTDAG